MYSKKSFKNQQTASLVVFVLGAVVLGAAGSLFSIR